VDDWEEAFAESSRRRYRASRLRSLMFVVIVTCALGSAVVILWLIVNQLWTMPLK
jgi:hypothetical protein